MKFFKKKEKHSTLVQLNCPAKEYPFTCNDPDLLNRHVGWRHRELMQNLPKKQNKIK